MSNLSSDVQKFAHEGVLQFKLEKPEILKELQTLLQPAVNNTAALENADFETYTQEVFQGQESLRTSGLVTKLIRAQTGLLSQFLGPDIDIQSAPHLRLSRPAKAADVIAWHRDTYYGSSPFELNIWFPVFDLPTGSGFMVVPKTHNEPPENLLEIQNTNIQVERGSLANKVGYLYAPKKEPLIDAITDDQILFLRPQVGEAIIFFSSLLHRARGGTDGIRVSVDVRVRHPFSPTSTKPGYYVELCRCPVFAAAKEFLQSSPEAAL